jgi:menaquinone-dependent protoporphyrinogen IX oxidase
MDNKILVAYASKSGSTVDVAQTIGKSLSAKGAKVDVSPVRRHTPGRVWLTSISLISIS